jgi:hypothetical protein
LSAAIIPWSQEKINQNQVDIAFDLIGFGHQLHHLIHGIAGKAGDMTISFTGTKLVAPWRSIAKS